MFTERGDGVAGIKRRRRDLSSDGVRNLATASGRGRLKEDLESSTWRRPSSANNTGAKPLVPSKTLREHSLPRACTFQGLKSKNPIHHIKHYLSIVDNIRADDVTRDTSRLPFFHFSLKGKAKEWLNKIPPTQITTWYQLVARFLDYFFLVGHTSFLRDMILRFKQGSNKPIKSAWIRFQDLIKQVPHHRIQKWFLVQIFHDNISQKDQGKLDQFAHFCFSSLIGEEGWNRIEEYVQYQDDLWDDPSPPMNTSSISEGNSRRKEVGESGPDWVIRSKFKDELAGFMLKKKFYMKGLGEMLDQHRGIHEQFSQILSEIGSSISINRGLIQAILTSLPLQPIGEVTKASNLRIIPPGVQGRSHFTYFLYLIVQNTNPGRSPNFSLLSVWKLMTVTALITQYLKSTGTLSEGLIIFIGTMAGVDVDTLTMEQYLALSRENQAPGVVKPEIRGNVNFEIKSQFMRELREDTFSGNKDEDAHDHIDRVLSIVGLFNIPGVTKDAVML
ncbi:zinc finger, CCHC-type containing protein [Tanacetum coccineum]|uniref:Zinc finger, CCHC-type containing protein n=1 Tax=Tanacetum coccineum TaxID=301880 RepID=A0ABQ5B7G0_9ASTR